jgi:hypothetical protein
MGVAVIRIIPDFSFLFLQQLGRKALVSPPEGRSGASRRFRVQTIFTVGGSSFRSSQKASLW